MRPRALRPWRLTRVPRQWASLLIFLSMLCTAPLRGFSPRRAMTREGGLVGKERSAVGLRRAEEQKGPLIGDNWEGENILSIRNLWAEAYDEDEMDDDEAAVGILKGVNLDIRKGEAHAIMGPNGSGKSTLSKVICGSPMYRTTNGTVTYKGIDLLALPVEERSMQGIFLAFQYPEEVPGISNAEFLRQAVNLRRLRQGQEEHDPVEFAMGMLTKLEQLDLDASFLERDLNMGFSGGEKKRNEVLQMLMLEPDLVILDETDSGLDVDSLKVAAKSIQTYRHDNLHKSFIIITHYRKLLDLIPVDRVSVIEDGRIARTGGPELADTIDAEGFTKIGKDDL